MIAFAVASPRSPSVVTFLFSDIEGSSRLWAQEPERMQPALARHDALVRKVVERNHGVIVKMTGDGVHAAFEDPLDAVDAALQLQQALADPDATSGIALRVRCGLHAGVVERRDNDFFGSPVNRAARIMAAAHGGQVLLSQAVAALIGDRLPRGVTLCDLGSVRLRDLARPEHVYQLEHPQLRAAFPALRTLEATPNNLSQQVTSFVGREQELAQVKTLLRTVRLLTLVGIGGIGKTRLSLQVAADTLHTYPDGVWLVEFGSITDPLLVPTSVAQVLGVQEQERTLLTQTLCAHLKSRRLLLVLDNCEHLIAACAGLVEALLAAAPEIRILATSREPLHVGGEQTFLVPPLSLPGREAGLESLMRAHAAQLFIERAQLRQPGFVLTEQQVPAMTALCTHLDGIPLALELAATRVHMLSIEEINARLDDRFKLLTGGARTALAHQQTLRATLDWSYGLLAETERAMLRRLAVFPGSFTFEAATCVASDEAIDKIAVIDLLSHLVAHSLVIVDTSDSVGARYRLLETTRTYALEKLAESGETDTTKRRHARYFHEFFERMAPEWWRMPDAKWRPLYLPELDNVRAALDWAMDANGDVTIGIALAGATRPLWTVYALSEGAQRLAAAAARIGSETPERYEAPLWFALGLVSQATPQQALGAFERAAAGFARLGDTLGCGVSLNQLGRTLARMGRFEESRRALSDALPLLEKTGLPKALGFHHIDMGFLKMQTGDLVGAKTHNVEALALFRSAGAEFSVLAALAVVADTNWALGDVNAAVTGYRETIALLRQQPMYRQSSIGYALGNLAGTLTERGDLDAALTAARDGLPLLAFSGNAWIFMDHFALRAALAGKIENAARVAGCADAIFAAKGATRERNEARARDRLRALLREKLSVDTLERLLAEGATMGEDQGCRLALKD